MSDGPEASSLRLFVGHGGWLPGQLEGELARGNWHLALAAATTVLGPNADSLWEGLVRRFEPREMLIRGGDTLNLRPYNLL